MNTIGERIAYLRTSKNISQRALMEELKISNLGRIEKNERLPGIEIIISLSNYFGVSTDWILKGSSKYEYKIKNTTVNFVSEDSSEFNNQLGVIGEDRTQKQHDIIEKFNSLDREEQIKIEGIIDGMLISKELNKKKCKSSISKNGGGEEAATNETA